MNCFISVLSLLFFCGNPSAKSTRNNFDPHVVHDLQNPLPPCGACNEWLLKIGEESHGFYVVTFQDLSLEVIHERFLAVRLWWIFVY